METVKRKTRKKIDVYSLLRVLVAILIGYGISFVLIFMFSEMPLEAIHKFLLGPFSNRRAFFNIIETMIPLLFAGLALNVLMKAGMMNLAADGSFYLGAVSAAAMAISWKLPSGMHPAVIIVLSACVGGIVTLVPTFIKKISSANELVVSLMLNYVCYWLGQLIINSFYLDAVFGYGSFKYEKTANLSIVIPKTQTHSGVILVAIVFVVVYFVMDRSEYGYRLRITGKNARFARASGIGVSGVIISSQFFGGALAGMGGAVEQLGIYHRFLWSAQQSFVWDALLVNLLASEKVIFIPLTAFFFSYVRVGADIMSRGTDIAAEIVAIIQGVIIFLVSAQQFMYRFKKRQEEQAVLAEKNAATAK